MTAGTGDTYLDLASNGSHTQKKLIQTSAGAGDAGKAVGVDGTGKFDISVMPVGIVAPTNTVTVVDSGGLAAGDLVQVFNNSGTAGVRRADASNGRFANGYVLNAFANGASALVYSLDNDTAKSGMTVGDQFLSDSTPGACTNTAPTTTGHIVQRVGFAISATVLAFQPMNYTTLA